MNFKLKIILLNLVLLTNFLSYTMHRSFRVVLQDIEKNEAILAELKKQLDHWKATHPSSSMREYGEEMDDTVKKAKEITANLDELTAELTGTNITSKDFITLRDTLKLIKEISLGNVANVQNIIASNVGSVDKADPKGNTPLMYAALLGNINILQLLLGAGANVNALNEREKTTALHKAVLSRNPEVVRLLILSGANAQLGRPLLDLAIRNARAGNPHDLEIIKLLINAGQKITKEDVDLAASKGLGDIAKALSSSLSASSKAASITPSSSSSSSSSRKIFAAKKKHDAPTPSSITTPSSTTSSSSSSIAPSVSSSSKTIIPAKVPSVHTPSTTSAIPASSQARTELLISKIRNRDLDSIKKLIAENVDLNLADAENKSTPLMYAAEAGLVDVIRQLIAAGANINAINREQDATALHYAVQLNHPDVVDLLLQLGANPNLGTSILGLAISHAKGLRIITALLNAGVIPTESNLQFAESRGINIFADLK